VGGGRGLVAGACAGCLTGRSGPFATPSCSTSPSRSTDGRRQTERRDSRRLGVIDAVHLAVRAESVLGRRDGRRFDDLGGPADQPRLTRRTAGLVAAAAPREVPWPASA
jgi:hypothetical protein